MSENKEESSSRELSAGAVVGPYRVLRQLGRGGMGTVYEVEHEALGVRYALKAFSVDDRNAAFFRKRFLAEGRLLARLRHPRLVRVYDLDVDAERGIPYFTMDLVLGPNGEPVTLADLQRKGVPEDRTAAWFKDLCEGLAYIHAQGVVHRDLKLENVLVGPDGHAVISDFGISRICAEDLRHDLKLDTMTLVAQDGEMVRPVLGTRLYLPPEVRDGGESTAAGDLWSLGVMVFRLLTGLWYEPGPRSLELLEAFDAAWCQYLPGLLHADPSFRRLPQLDGAWNPRPRPVRRTVSWPAVAAAALVFGLAGWFLRGTCDALPDGAEPLETAAQLEAEFHAALRVSDLLPDEG